MTTQGTTNFNKKAFFASVAALVIPMSLQNLINVGVQSADVIMLGRVGEISLSGASLAGQVQFVMTLFLFGLSSGATVLTAQYWGKGEIRAIEKILSITMRLSLCVAVLFSALAFFAPASIMRIFTSEADVIAQGVRYLRFVAPSYLFMGVTNIYLNIMRSVEKVVASTVIYFISFVVNIFFNIVFIFGIFGAPAMGTAGAALGTTLARFLELIIVVAYAARNPILRIRKKDYTHWHLPLFKDFMRFSAPTILNELLWGLAISANAAIIGRLGAEAVSANSVGQVVRQLATVVCFGVANAAAIMIGKALGANEKEKAKVYASYFIKITLLWGVIGSGIILALRPFITGMLNLSPQANEYLRFLMLWLAIYVIAQSFNTTMVVGVFRGGGDTKFGLFMDGTVMWGGSILWGALAAFVFRLPVMVVYMVILSDEFIKLPIAFIRYKSKKWIRNITR